MELTTLGRTGLRVSRLGLGLASLGRPGYINLGHAEDLGAGPSRTHMEQGAFRVLDAAWELGIRYFDAARSYGAAEEFLAHWLAERGIEPSAVTVGSKWGYTYTAGWSVHAERHEVKDHSLATLHRQTAESRQILGTQLDLYQIHSATLESGVLDRRDVLEELARLRDSGLHVGLSLTGPGQAETLRRALEVVVGGAPVFCAVQATWNLLERSAGPALAEAHEAGLGVVIKEALANGRLSGRNDAPDFTTSRVRLESVAARFGSTLDAVSLAAAMARPWVDVVLSGATTVAQLQSNVGALEIPWDSALEAELAPLAEPSREYWETRSRLPWN